MIQKTMRPILVFVLIAWGSVNLSAQMSGVSFQFGTSSQINNNETMYHYGIQGDYELTKKGFGLSIGGMHMISTNPGNYFGNKGADGYIVDSSSSELTINNPALHLFAPYVGGYYTSKNNNAAKAALRAGINVGYMLGMDFEEFSGGAPFAEINGGVIAYVHENIGMSANLGFMSTFSEMEYEAYSFQTDEAGNITEQTLHNSSVMPMQINIKFGVHYIIGHDWRY